MKKGLWCTILIFLLAGCNGSDSSLSDEEAGSSWDINIPAIYSSTTKLTVHAAYETGQAPYTDTVLNGREAWSILQDNLEALFEGRAIVPEIIVPMELSEMKTLSDQGQATWTTTEIFNLAQSVWSGTSSASSAHFHVLFLSGHFKDNGVEKPTVIGISINGKSVLAIFKEVVAASPTIMVAHYVEQATLVHELGHALGLVNNGLPMTSPHQDTDHGRHCTNSDCVMYWQNEGSADLYDYAQQVILSGNTVMFGSECLDDAGAYNP